MKVFFLISLFLMSDMVFGDNPKPDDRLNTASTANYLSDLEKEVVHEINLFRSDPAQYAEKYIAPLAGKYQKKILNYPGGLPIKTQEGVSALHECVRELNKESAISILYPNPALSKAARDHQRDQSKTGKTGHVGADRSNLRDRIERYGKWQVSIAENIAYGNTSARQIVVFLLIDDGVKNRGHRDNLLNPDFKLVGVSCGKHPVYNTICVMDFAGGMKKRE